MTQLRILCTGNPKDFTIARGVCEVFPHAQFASRATGFDLRMWEDRYEDYFKEQIANYDVLINSSFVSNGAQQKILELTREVWKTGHVFNIGSTAEYEGRNSFLPHYSAQKRSLRDVGMAMNSKDFKVTHLTVGLLNDNKPGNQHGLNPITVAQVIKWVLDSGMNIPIIGVEP